ncbi:MAG: nuclear transport factor 2 family protein [Pseudomonadales bacterium]|nr:nuclear transport factor 2 family protein [Halioglobus sp.]MCP5123688.1 nuclear transport factor 2 family protein [Pseudomonadales bacterium]MCP5192009.1 nuclear transport factor 2 family protein [Pseudomonadales bacterium]
MSADIGAVPGAQVTAHREAIREVLAVHSRGLDRNEAALIKSAYWPEAEVDYGAFKGPAHQFADLVGPALAAAYELTQHLLGQTFIAVDGNRACTETYVHARHLLHGAGEELAFAGRYLDQLELRQGHWKILHRLVVMDWSLRQPVRDERRGEAFGALAKGSANREDPSHALLPTS